MHVRKVSIKNSKLCFFIIAILNLFFFIEITCYVSIPCVFRTTDRVLLLRLLQLFWRPTEVFVSFFFKKKRNNVAHLDFFSNRSVACLVRKFEGRKTDKGKMKRKRVKKFHDDFFFFCVARHCSDDRLSFSSIGIRLRSSWVL